MKYDIFNGTEIKEGEQPIQHITKMCLNCTSLIEEESGYRCCNENVMASGRKKVTASLPEGFEIDTLILKPMVLKNPTKKCGNYEFNIDAIIAAIEEEIKQ